ncbi:cytochrome c biogenesis CcdA family protein [Kibdelosporangium persicum]|uniref:Cytochrome c biogenesis protein transmembrane region n=1 Tax=Kibdelosporangium persicum TaxID=2698649 RepID=A0ABX2FB43_9PSEU|nr:cytochrome c biogenesis CcdA family protein [Kibdelosporangium persicum]NRN68584.1 Cytochrome c biogenesis protein transmembrane region [Kibdelosporangium persicum]
MNPTEIAASGPLLLASGLALLAGMISFASPCVVPLVPGYLAYLAALVGADAPAVNAEEQAKRGRYRVVGAVGLFVLGFTVVFTATVGSLVWLSDQLIDKQDMLQRVGGVVMILMALVFVGLVPKLQRDIRIHKLPRGGLVSAPILGAIFALGWTPCIGPTLSGVLTIAASTGESAARGMLLVLIYCAGLGVPFLLIALGARWAVRATGWLRRNGRKVQIFGGVLMFAVGVLLITGLWGEFIAWMRYAFITDTGLPL